MILNVHNQSDFSEEIKKYHDYIRALEDERVKIQVFKRELPLCLELVTQAIVRHANSSYRGTTSTECNLHDQSKCSEQTSCPIFEQFLPLKMADEGQNHSKLNNDDADDVSSWKKSEWLRSVQLWNQNPDPPSKEVDFPEVILKESGGLKKETISLSGDHLPSSSAPPAEKSKEKDSQRKSRRCWSAELHRRFVQALQQLGGSHVATPKQIRELMNVDGLTNDEVKSHLQKYRLHTRRPNHSNPESSSQTPQFVVVGGIWVQPEWHLQTPVTVLPPPPLIGFLPPSPPCHHLYKKTKK